MYVECQCPHADAYKSDQGAISHLVDEEYVEQVLASEPDIQNIVVSQMHATWTQVDLAITKGINRNNFAPLHIAVGGVHNFKFNEQHKKILNTKVQNTVALSTTMTMTRMAGTIAYTKSMLEAWPWFGC